MRPLLLPLLLLCAPAFGQKDCAPLDSAGTVSIKNATAADLSARAKAWFAGAYTNSKAMVQRRDDSTRVVVGAGMSEYPLKHGGYVSYSVEVACKDGAYTFKVHALAHDNSDAEGTASALPSYGLLYDCSTCCELYKAQAKDAPAAVAKNTKVCEKDILPKSRAVLAQVVASLTTGMGSKTP